MTYITPRPSIHQHNRKCAVNALINVAENWRDDESVTDTEVITALQENLWYTAREYLENGSTICQCPPCEEFCCSAINSQNGGRRLVGAGENIRWETVDDEDMHPYETGWTGL